MPPKKKGGRKKANVRIAPRKKKKKVEEQPKDGVSYVQLLSFVKTVQGVLTREKKVVHGESSIQLFDEVTEVFQGIEPKLDAWKNQIEAEIAKIDAKKPCIITEAPLEIMVKILENLHLLERNGLELVSRQFYDAVSIIKRKTLDFYRCWDITDDIVLSMVRSASDTLEFLSFRECWWISQATVIECISMCPKLLHLDLVGWECYGPQTKATSLFRAIKKLKLLTHLGLPMRVKSVAKALTKSLKMPSVKHIELYNCNAIIMNELHTCFPKLETIKSMYSLGFNAISKADKCNSLKAYVVKHPVTGAVHRFNYNVRGSQELPQSDDLKACNFSLRWLPKFLPSWHMKNLTRLSMGMGSLDSGRARIDLKMLSDSLPNLLDLTIQSDGRDIRHYKAVSGGLSCPKGSIALFPKLVRLHLTLDGRGITNASMFINSLPDSIRHLELIMVAEVKPSNEAIAEADLIELLIRLDLRTLKLGVQPSVVNIHPIEDWSKLADYTAVVTDELIDKLCSSRSNNIATLGLNNCAQLTDSSMDKLTRKFAEGLESLSLVNIAKCSSQAVADFVGASTNLQELTILSQLTGNSIFVAHSISTVLDYNKLWFLRLGLYEAMDEALNILQGSCLRRVVIVKPTEISFDALHGFISKSPKLKSLHVQSHSKKRRKKYWELMEGALQTCRRDTLRIYLYPYGSTLLTNIAISVLDLPQTSFKGCALK